MQMASDHQRDLLEMIQAMTHCTEDIARTVDDFISAARLDNNGEAYKNVVRFQNQLLGEMRSAIKQVESHLQSHS